MIVSSNPNCKIINRSRWISALARHVAICVVNNNLKIQRMRRKMGIINVAFEGFTVYGCYLSSNIPMDDFERTVDGIVGWIEQDGRRSHTSWRLQLEGLGMQLTHYRQ